jgi:4'-phosphopantetheinyl transferase
MPVVLSQQSSTKAWAVWKIVEDEATLLQKSDVTEGINPSLTHPHKRLEFAAGRALMAWLLNQNGITNEGIYKDTFGKPFLKNSLVHISLSHSYPFVAAIIDFNKNTGIDLEQPKQNLLRVAPRILNTLELQNAANDVIKHCVYWCAKETLIKVYGKKDLIFKEEMLLDNFSLSTSGSITGHILRKGHESTHALHYVVEKDFVIVFVE